MAVDGALMVEVLPNRDDSARDLSFLNAANSLPIVFAPGIGATLVKTTGYPGLFIATIVLAVLGSLCITRVTRVNPRRNRRSRSNGRSKTTSQQACGEN